MLLGPDRMKTLLETAFKKAGADAEGVLEVSRQAVTRFAANRIHQNVAEEDARASFRVAMGRRVGGARTNGRDRQRLAECVRTAARVAQAQREDPEFPGFVRSECAPAPPGAALDAYDITTASLSPRDRARAVLPAVRLAGESGFEASGALTVSSTELAVANTLGTFRYQPSTWAQLHVVVRSGDAEAAWTETSERWTDIDPVRVARLAVERCKRSLSPVEIEPGDWPVVLEPEAVADMLELLAWMGLGATAVLEGRSFLCGRSGERVASEKVTILDDGLRPGSPPRPFDYEGVSKRRVVFIDKGVARGPVYDTRTAARAGTQSTGHALPEPNTFGPYPLNLAMEPGDSSLDEMIASTARGVLVSRFHYTNPVDPRKTVITGMTRFGTFLIEDGKVTKAVKSMRFTDSILDGLSRVEAVGKELRRVEDTLAPAVKLSSWRFTGVTA